MKKKTILLTGVLAMLAIITSIGLKAKDLIIEAEETELTEPEMQQIEKELKQMDKIEEKIINEPIETAPEY